MFLNNSFYIDSHGAIINILIWPSSFFYLFRLFYLSTRFFSVLKVESSASIHWLTGLTNLFLSFWLFPVHFWMLWMLVTMHKPCHVPHASQITTSRLNFTEICFGVSKEWVRSWLHVFLISWLKSFWQSVQNKWREAKTEKKLEWQLQKLFALNANAIVYLKILLIRIRY